MTKGDEMSIGKLKALGFKGTKMRSSLEKGEEYTLYTKEGCAVSFSHWRDGVWLIATGISCNAVFAEDMARVLDMLEEDDHAK